MKEIGLKYNNEIPGEETIEINIDWEKVVFDKVQPIQGIVIPKKWDNYWQASMDAIKELWWRKWIKRELFDKIVKIFWWKAELFWLDIYKFYWSATNDDDNTDSAWCGYFDHGYMYLSTKDYPYGPTICIHD
jgi:hypothetical protein